MMIPWCKKLTEKENNKRGTDPPKGRKAKKRKMDLLEDWGESTSSSFSSHVVEKHVLATARKDWLEKPNVMPVNETTLNQTTLSNWRLNTSEAAAADDETVPDGWKCQADAEESTGGPSHHFGVGAPLQQINTRARVSIDNVIPTGWKDDDEEVPEGWKSQAVATGGPSHHTGVGAPLHQINTRACVSTDKSVPAGWKIEVSKPSQKIKKGKLTKKEVREMKACHNDIKDLLTVRRKDKTTTTQEQVDMVTTPTYEEKEMATVQSPTPSIMSVVHTPVRTTGRVCTERLLYTRDSSMAGIKASELSLQPVRSADSRITVNLVGSPEMPMKMDKSPSWVDGRLERFGDAREMLRTSEKPAEECSLGREGARRRSRRISELCELFEGGEGDKLDSITKTSSCEVGPGERGGSVNKIIYEGSQTTKRVSNESRKFTFIDHGVQNVDSGGNKEILARQIRRRGQ